ncbi:histidinol-phosphatase HisJ [Metabacillus sp. Hm71]|uniref:histidinol-phosphatase HisJ n=1 Tax=Metabacillus sp. Hm71 TaxID=3450743 RepID=UPI003F433581
MKKDGHVHSPYCPHGTADRLEEYIEQAIKEGFDCLTFTEHAPLPIKFKDPTPDEDSAMKLEDIDSYLSDLKILKEKYRNHIKINIGLEVDYIKEYEHETKRFLNQYGKFLDDSILSVHFLKLNDTYFCMDFDEKIFGKMVEFAGSLQDLHYAYYQEVLHSIKSDLGPYKPKRIGHLTLVHKFQKLYPITFPTESIISKVLKAIKDHGLEIDFNVAGLRKEFCGETYPGEAIAKFAQKQKIPLIYGSDAHSARDVGKNYSHYDQLTNGS